jgi:mono/diheme cytochrome c family protein
MKRYSILIMTGVLAACGGGEPAAEAPASQPAATTTAAAPAPAAFDAAATFNTVCATCHGAGGLGDGPAGMALDPKPASFADAEFWETRDDDHIFTVIKEGGAAVGRSPLMVGWGASYDDEQIWQLVEHVKSFQPAG